MSQKAEKQGGREGPLRVTTQPPPGQGESQIIAPPDIRDKINYWGSRSQSTPKEPAKRKNLMG